MTDDQELNERMESSSGPSFRNHARTAGDEPSMECSPSSKGDHRLANVVQWTSDDGRRFIPAAKTCTSLPPSLYQINQSASVGIYFENVPIRTEGLLRFPQANSDRVVSEIQKFWEREDHFRRFKLVHKRGIFLWGPPGSGKSCTIQLIMRDVIERGGAAINFCHPDLFLEGMRLFRSIQPKTPVVVLMEDIDEIMNRFPESQILNMLDGVELLDKTVFLASSNYPENLGPRIVNRPSRFDKRFKIGHPNDESRLIYFEHLLKDHPEERKKHDLEQWVEDTDGLSLAHLKELFVAVVILEDDYGSAIETLQSMRERLSSENGDGPMGFSGRMIGGIRKKTRRIQEGFGETYEESSR